MLKWDKKTSAWGRDLRGILTAIGTEAIGQGRGEFPGGKILAFLRNGDDAIVGTR